MADLVLRESQGWFEVDPREVLDPDTLYKEPDNQYEVFNAIDVDAIVDRLDEAELLGEAALGAFERDELWDHIFDDVRIFQEFYGLKGWQYRVWVHVMDEALYAG